MEEAAKEGRRSGQRQSRVHLTPVNTGWEAGLGTMPGKEPEGRKSSQASGADVLCLPAPHQQDGGKGGLPEVACDLETALCLSLCNVYTDPSPRTAPCPQGPVHFQCPAWALTQRWCPTECRVNQWGRKQLGGD